MIGSAKITYDNENVCQLVRKDLVDKFGNRELANYNLYLPGVIRSKAVVTAFPDPEIKVTSVEDQLKEMGIYPKPSVSRGPDTVKVLPNAFGKAAISSVFDADSCTLTVSGGPVPYTVRDEDNEDDIPDSAHWYRIAVNFPLGVMFEEDDLVGCTVNGFPAAHAVTDEEEEHACLYFNLDAKYTSLDIVIGWKGSNAPETLHVVCNASLASAAVKKIPVLPTEPVYEFIYPSDYAVDSNVQVDVDLDLGKE